MNNEHSGLSQSVYFNEIVTETQNVFDGKNNVYKA